MVRWMNPLAMHPTYPDVSYSSDSAFIQNHFDTEKRSNLKRTISAPIPILTPVHQSTSLSHSEHASTSCRTTSITNPSLNRTNSGPIHNIRDTTLATIVVNDRHRPPLFSSPSQTTPQPTPTITTYDPAVLNYLALEPHASVLNRLAKTNPNPKRKQRKRPNSLPAQHLEPSARLIHSSPRVSLYEFRPRNAWLQHSSFPTLHCRCSHTHPQPPPPPPPHTSMISLTRLRRLSQTLRPRSPAPPPCTCPHLHSYSSSYTPSLLPYPSYPPYTTTYSARHVDISVADGDPDDALRATHLRLLQRSLREPGYIAGVLGRGDLGRNEVAGLLAWQSARGLWMSLGGRGREDWKWDWCGESGSVDGYDGEREREGESGKCDGENDSDGWSGSTEGMEWSRESDVLVLHGRKVKARRKGVHWGGVNIRSYETDGRLRKINKRTRKDMNPRGSM